MGRPYLNLKVCSRWTLHPSDPFSASRAFAVTAARGFRRGTFNSVEFDRIRKPLETLHADIRSRPLTPALRIAHHANASEPGTFYFLLPPVCHEPRHGKAAFSKPPTPYRFFPLSFVTMTAHQATTTGQDTQTNPYRMPTPAEWDNMTSLFCWLLDKAEEHYPKYYRCDGIAACNDLLATLDGSRDEDLLGILKTCQRYFAAPDDVRSRSLKAISATVNAAITQAESR